MEVLITCWHDEWNLFYITFMLFFYYYDDGLLLILNSSYHISCTDISLTFDYATIFLINL